MVLTQDKNTDIKTAALAEFDDQTHIGFGTSNQTPSASDTDLISPIIRKSFDETATKNVTAGTYDFSATLGLTEGNTNDMKETGLFNAASSGDMALRELLNQTINKNANNELSVGIRLTVTVTNT